MRKSLLLLLPAAILLFSHLGQAQSGPIELPDLIRSDEGRIALSVSSSEPATQMLAQRAFALHGGIALTSPDAAAFVVRIEPAGGGDAALLTVGSGQPYQEQLRRTISGLDYNNAVLRACDAVVEATLRTKGFFAGKLAFVGKQRTITEIYTTDLMFSRVRPLTRDRALVTGPRWSPDGNRLLYTTYHKSGFPDIYAINLRTGRKEPIATYKGTKSGGAFRTIGRRIAMAHSVSGHTEI